MNVYVTSDMKAYERCHIFQLRNYASKFTEYIQETITLKADFLGYLWAC